jgi:hypothetical protein
MCPSLLIYTVQPYLIRTCHAMFLPCCSQGQGTARPSRDGLWATYRVLLLPATTRSSTKIVIRSISISDAGGQCENKQRLSWTRKRVVTVHYKEDNLLNCWTSSSDISGYHADFHEGRHYHSMAGARHGLCELTARHGHGMLCVNRPL